MRDLVLDDGWEAAACPPDTHTDATTLDGLEWLSARVPGTAAGVLRDADRWRPGDPCDLDLDAEDWWWRTSFDAKPVAAGEEVRLCLDGIATVAEVYLNGEPVLESDSMFAAHALDVTARLRERNELAIRCRALAPLLRERRKPRARWRTRLVSDGNLRFFRTMLLGRLPGIAPGPAAVGPWRAVRLERLRGIDVEELRLRTRLDGESGVLSILARLRRLDGAEAGGAVEVELDGPSGAHRRAACRGRDARPGRSSASLRPGASCWFHRWRAGGHTLMADRSCTTFASWCTAPTSQPSWMRAGSAFVTSRLEQCRARNQRRASSRQRRVGRQRQIGWQRRVTMSSRTDSTCM